MTDDPNRPGGGRRRSLRPSDRRLLVGYGPAVVMAVGFLLMALLVPTVAPEQNVSSATAARPGAQGSVAPGTSVPGTSAGGGASPAGGAAAPGQPNGVSASADGSVAQCSGPQVPNDPYSPPCTSFSGDNGGATSRGVTADTITVTFRISADEVLGIDSLISRIAGKSTSSQFNETRDDVERTVQDLVTYFNGHFQLYGRKLVLKFVDGQGQLLDEFQNAGQARANADALNVGQQIGAFAETFAVSQPYAEALSAQHVVSIGAPYMSRQWFEEHAPYAWSFFPAGSDLGLEGAAIATQELAVSPVAWAGSGVANGQPRRIAVLAPDNPIYQQSFRVAEALSQAGHPAVDNLTYTLSLTQLSQEMSAITQRLINDKITTLVAGVDPIALIFLTGDLTNAHYIPEILNIGAAFTDLDYVAQLFDPTTAAHIAGVTNSGGVPPFGSSLAYFAAKSVDPDHPPAREVDTYYSSLYLLALGIQQAGPNLTPETFQQGLMAYPGGDGQYGPWSFNVGGTPSWTPQHQFHFEWWDPTATSTYNGQQGSWVIDPTWHTPDDVPSGQPPVFPGGAPR